MCRKIQSHDMSSLGQARHLYRAILASQGFSQHRCKAGHIDAVERWHSMASTGWRPLGDYITRALPSESGSDAGMLITPIDVDGWCWDIAASNEVKQPAGYHQSRGDNVICRDISLEWDWNMELFRNSTVGYVVVLQIYMWSYSKKISYVHL